MSRERGLLEVSLLYDTARGFLGLREPDKVLRHAILSLLGSCGTTSAMFLEREDGGPFRLRACRGFMKAPDATLRLGRIGERVLLGNPGPHVGEELRRMGPGVVRWVERHGVRLVVGLQMGHRLTGILAAGPKILGEAFTHEDLSLVREIAGLTTLALTRETTDVVTTRRAPRRRVSALDRLRRDHPALQLIRGDGPSTLALFEELLALSEFELPVLLIGETGTGKDLVARALHDLSPRAAESFEAINCVAIPRDLVASALFGHERGAFTGAVSMVRGAFERAGAGTLFLDEIGDMPLETQATLLRVLQERRFRRVGGEKTIPAMARVISATNRDLVRAVKSQSFRADLFYRVQMYSVRIPPLRERKEEIPALVAHILKKHRPRRGPEPIVSPEFLGAISRMELPGNIRELEGLVLGALVRARGERVLRPEHLGPAVGIASAETDQDPVFQGPSRPGVPSYDEMERAYIRSVLQLTEKNVKRAAALMGIPRTTLNARIKKLGLGREADNP